MRLSKKAEIKKMTSELYQKIDEFANDCAGKLQPEVWNKLKEIHLLSGQIDIKMMGE